MTTLDAYADVADDDAPANPFQRCLDRARHFWGELNGDCLPLYLPSVVSVGFGFVLTLPINTFASGASFAFMDRLARMARLDGWGELAWGMGFILGGCWHICWLYQRHPHCNVARSFVVATWIFVVLLFAFSFWATTGIIAYGGYAWLGHWGRSRVRPRD